MTTVKVVTFGRPKADGTLACHRVGKYLADRLGVPLEWTRDSMRGGVDVLYVVAAPYRYCDCLPEIAATIKASKRVVWVENDYSLRPPPAVSKAASPFSGCIRDRADAGSEPLHFMTTLEKHGDATPLSSYVNWNLLAYEFVGVKRAAMVASRLFYYGSHRDGRVRSFERYFRHPTTPVALSVIGKKFEDYRSDLVTVEPVTPRSQLGERMTGEALGLYLSDARSDREYHSPAGRFYEMLSAGLPMVFEPKSVAMLERAGIKDVARYAAAPEDLPHMLGCTTAIYQEQQHLWARDYRGDLDKQVDDAILRVQS